MVWGRQAVAADITDDAQALETRKCGVENRMGVLGFTTARTSSRVRPARPYKYPAKKRCQV
jgi:hypothetical protein